MTLIMPMLCSLSKRDDANADCLAPAANPPQVPVPQPRVRERKRSTSTSSAWTLSVSLVKCGPRQGQVTWHRACSSEKGGPRQGHAGSGSPSRWHGSPGLYLDPRSQGQAASLRPEGRRAMVLALSESACRGGRVDCCSGRIRGRERMGGRACGRWDDGHGAADTRC